MPFVADFLLISTYPAYMNETADTKQDARAILSDTRDAMREVLATRNLLHPIALALALTPAKATLTLTLTLTLALTLTL